MSRPDISASALQAATGLGLPDSARMIACPQPCNVRYAAAYSIYSRDVTRYAASWDHHSFKFVPEYEFENQILGARGYSPQWR